MYELFILGQLMDHPMTGYQLRKALSSTVGPELTISFGALYPLLDKLAAAGTLTLAFKTVPPKRPQKLARITAAGRARFHTLMATPVAFNKQTQLTFQMKVNFLHLLTPDQQRATLREFHAFATQQLSQLATQRAHNPHMVAADIQDALRVNQLQTVRAQAQADWVTAQLNQLTKE